MTASQRLGMTLAPVSFLISFPFLFVASIVMTFVVSPLATPGFAQSAADLDLQQSVLARRLNQLDQLAEAHRQYLLVRDVYFQGPDGATTRANLWLTRAEAWNVEWTTLLKLVESSQELDDDAVQQRIRELLAGQISTWESLRRDAQLVVDRVREGRARLAAIADVSSLALAGDGQQLLASSRLALDQALAATAVGFEAEAQVAWQLVGDETQRAVLRRLRRAMLSYPTLAQAVARVEETLRAESEAEPYVWAVQAGFNRLRDHLLRKRYFHAVDALNALRATSQSSDAALQTVSLPEAQLRRARDSMARTLAAGEALFAEATRSFTPGMLVASFATTEARSLAADCRDEVLRLQRRCDLLRHLASIPSAAIIGMTPQEAREIEFSFARVRR